MYAFPRLYCQTSFLILDISSLKTLKPVSCFLLVIKKSILKYLGFLLKRVLYSQKYWSLTFEGKFEKIFLDFCSIPKLRFQIYFVLTRPGKLHLVFLCTDYCFFTDSTYYLAKHSCFYFIEKTSVSFVLCLDNTHRRFKFFYMIFL